MFHVAGKNSHKDYGNGFSKKLSNFWNPYRFDVVKRLPVLDIVANDDYIAVFESELPHLVKVVLTR